MKITHRVLILFLAGLIAQGIYLGSQSLVLHHLRVTDIDLLLPYEDQIPFLPLCVIIYLSVYVFPAWVFLSLSQKGRVLKVLIVFFAALVIHTFFFILIPIEYAYRPTLNIPSVLLQELFLFVHSLDAPINTFPSMHVSFAFLSYYVAKRYQSHWANIFLIMSIAVAISTLLVKQHYILDVVSGIVIAVLLNELMLKRDLKAVLSSTKKSMLKHP